MFALLVANQVQVAIGQIKNQEKDKKLWLDKVMIHKIIKAFYFLLALAIIGFCGWLIFKLIFIFPEAFKTLDKSVQAALVTAVTTLFVAIATVLLARRFEKAKEIEQSQREK